MPDESFAARTAPEHDEVDSEAHHIRELCNEVDRLVLDGAWDAVVAARDGARAALERGHQLWPVAAYAEYRMALDGPPQIAASIVDSTASRFTLGPFPEVMATTHTWDELAPFLPSTPGSASVAHEFVAYGVSLHSDTHALQLPAVYDVPLVLAEWEPVYASPIYHLDRVEHPMPKLPPCQRVTAKLSKGTILDDSTVSSALCALVRPWVAESNGRAEAMSIDGTALSAIATLGVSQPLVAELTSSEAIELMAWVASGGGAYGRRRGSASARSDVWWALAALTGLDESDHIDPDELGEALSDLNFWLWSAGEPDTGWAFRLAIESPDEGLAWAVSAVDAR